ncbi:MAG: SMP-30/gluconolactonase/LRE family protein [Verrucomicrobiota bacterium]
MLSPLINEHCQLGENPLWNVEDQCVYWEDIDGGKVHRFNPATREHKVIYEGITVGGFTFQANGDLLLFRVYDLALLLPNGTVDVLRTFTDKGMTRFNDVIADPEGRVFAGTIGKTSDSGGLFRVDRDGAITLLFRGTGCSNGMGFSPDLKIFYWTCSTRRRIYAFDYDRVTGALANERILYQANDSEGIPDGMTVDRDGHIWSTRWDGYAVIHHAPDGKVLEKFPVPVAKASSACFGGKDLDRLFITTAGGVSGSNTAEGTLYELIVPARGNLEFKSRIRSR